MGMISQAMLKVYELSAPRWTKEVLITKKDALGAFEFWDHFKVPMPAEMKRIRKKLRRKSYKKMTLEDQIVIARVVLGDIASCLYAAFQDEMFQPISVEAAEHLKRANQAKKY